MNLATVLHRQATGSCIGRPLGPPQAPAYAGAKLLTTQYDIFGSLQTLVDRGTCSRLVEAIMRIPIDFWSCSRLDGLRRILFGGDYICLDRPRRMLKAN